MLDAWTNVFQVPAKRTTGTHAQKCAIVEPSSAARRATTMKGFLKAIAVLLLAASIYAAWRIVPVYFTALRVDWLLHSAAAEVDTSMVAAGMSGPLAALVDRTRAAVSERTGAGGGQLEVTFETNGDNARLNADYSVTVTDPWLSISRQIVFHRHGEAPIRAPRQ